MKISDKFFFQFYINHYLDFHIISCIWLIVVELAKYVYKEEYAAGGSLHNLIQEKANEGKKFHENLC